MKSLFNLITLAAMMVVAATIFTTATPAAAAGYETRMPLTVAEVTTDARWNDLAKAVVGDKPFTDNADLEEAPLPPVVAGKMFGGAWGKGGGYEPMRLGTAGWTLFKLKKEVPGIMVTLDSGVFLHAELGDKGTAFLFVGLATSTSAATDTAALLDSLLNKGGELWPRFETAVANTTAVENLQDADIALADRVAALEKKAGITPAPESGAEAPGAENAEAPGADAAPGGDSGGPEKATDQPTKPEPERTPPWWRWLALIAGLIVVAVAMIWRHFSLHPEPYVDAQGNTIQPPPDPEGAKKAVLLAVAGVLLIVVWLAAWQGWWWFA